MIDNRHLNIKLKSILAFTNKNPALILEFKKSNFFVLFPFLVLIFLFRIVIKIFNKKNYFRDHRDCTLSISFSINQYKILRLLKYPLFSFYNLKFISKSSIEIIKAILKYNFNKNFIRIIFQNLNDHNLRLNFSRIIKLLIIEPKIFDLINNSKKIIISNDHSIQNLLIIEYCRILKKNSIYIQHAPVNNKFLPLKTDLAVLYSKSDYNIYSKIGISNQSKILIACNIPISILYTNYNKIKKNDDSKNILICTNLLDNFELVFELADFLKKNGFNITLRLHPADKRRISKFEVSSNSLVNDLKINKYVIVNESAVILEAMALKKFTYKYNFTKLIDNYGYIKNKLITKVYSNKYDILKDIKINKITYNFDNLNYYTGNIKKISSVVKLIENKIDDYGNK